MSADLLWAMNHDALWSVKQTADLLHLSLSAAYRYYGGRELPYSKLRQFIQHAPEPVSTRLLGGLTTGTPHRHFYFRRQPGLRR